MFNVERWKGKVAVVTGASAGIGNAITKMLSENGIIVVALARSGDKLQELAKKCSGKIHTRICDLQKESDILSTFRWIESALGGVDILINNAAVANNDSLIDGKSSKWSEMLSTNIQALNICTREGLKSMRKRGDNGHIIHLNSVLGHRAFGYYSLPIGVYIATKHAVTALTEALRIELQAVNSQIKISSISPGVVNTDMFNSVVRNENVVNGGNDQSSKSDVLTPEDVAEVVLFVITRRPIIQVQDIIFQPVGQKFG